MLQEKLILLKKLLIEFAAIVEAMVNKSINGLLKKEKKMLEEVIKKDEPETNDLEIKIDEMCTNLIAQYQPTAKDLRITLMVLKMSNDLERMGDHAVNIAESAIFLIERPQLKPLIDILKMGETVTRMLQDSINSFINENAELAKSVCEKDNIVDNLRNETLRELITFMSADSSNIERSIHLLRVSQNLERIADLSTNIGEDVMFMVKGKVIKHHQDEKKS